VVLAKGLALFEATAFSYRHWPNLAEVPVRVVIESLLGDGLQVAMAFHQFWSTSWGRGLPPNFAMSWLMNLAVVGVVSLLAQRLVLMLAAAAGPAHRALIRRKFAFPQ